VPHLLKAAGQHVLQKSAWAAPHFLVHLKWEFVKRPHIHIKSYIRTRILLIFLSQDELNSFGVA
jgi:hypothetical protein